MSKDFKLLSILEYNSQFIGCFVINIIRSTKYLLIKFLEKSNLQIIYWK